MFVPLKHSPGENRPFVQFTILILFLLQLPLWSGTEVLFTKPVDKRVAWLGNDAQGEVNFPARIVNLINSATSSIDVATMTFNTQDGIADALAAQAASGLQVRLIVDRARRTQPSVLRSLRGPVMIADNNLPALVTRVNFQENGAVTPPGGWLTDSGLTFQNQGAFSYGWAANATMHMQGPQPADAGDYTSTLLGHCYARPNTTSNTWEIELPNGYYYVHLVVGEASYGSQNHIQVEGQDIFRFNGFFGQYLNCGPGEFKGANVLGGQNDNDGLPESRRIQVNDGRLSVTVGQNQGGVSTWSSLCYLEIYRADPVDQYGDNFSNKAHVQEMGLHHSKYILVDGATASPELWISSGNLTSSIDPGGRTEDALLTDESSICDAFRDQFNQNWGGAVNPDPGPAAFNRFKTNPTDIHGIYNAYMNDTFDWTTHFLPSVDGLNMSVELENFIDSADRDLIFLMEQFTHAGFAFGQNSSAYLMDGPVFDQVDAGLPLFGAIGMTPPEDIYSAYMGYPNAQLAYSDTMHHKVLLKDALRDSRYSGQGQLVVGSMNWSQSGMLRNDEQLLVIEDPAITNQFLQRAISELDGLGIAPDPRVDLILVLDRSLSMNALCTDGVTSLLEASKMAAQLFVDIMEKDAGHRVSLVRFGSVVEPYPGINLQPLTNAWQGVLNASITNTFATAPIGNSTCYGAALNECFAQLDGIGDKRPRQIVHFFTDGKENTAPWADPAYHQLRDAGMEIHSTAFNAFNIFNGQTAILEEMASETSGTFEQVPNDAVDLQKRFIEVARQAMDLDMLLDPTYLITRDKPVSETLDIDASATTLKFIVAWSRNKPYQVSLGLTTPEGIKVKPDAPGISISEQNGHLVWHVNLEKLSGAYGGLLTEGAWKVEMGAGEKFEGTMEADLIVLGDTNVDFKADVFGLEKRGESRVQLLARMLYDNEGLTKGNVDVVWKLPLEEGQTQPNTKTLTLYDDGKHGDGKAKDGLFGYSLDLKTWGNHRFHFVSEMVVPGKKVDYTIQRREAHVGYTVYK